jgi:CheY-like chemotaxis protein
MEQETLAHLFEPFFTTKGMGQGTGLGLATVYGIVKQNDGFISVDSEMGKGTMFKIFLPRYVSDTNSVSMVRPEKEAKGGTETILLVEDDPMVLEISKMLLEELGYTVLTANTPGESIRLAEKHAGKIDLLITDVVMPEMNGRELTNRLLSRYPELGTLYMSGYTSNVIAPRGVLERGICFLQKPFTKDSLAEKVREALKGNS